MNVILYVPFKGETLFWHLAGASLGLVQLELAERYQGAVNTLFDGVYEMYCHDESTHPITIESEE